MTKEAKPLEPWLITKADLFTIDLNQFTVEDKSVYNPMISLIVVDEDGDIQNHISFITEIYDEDPFGATLEAFTVGIKLADTWMEDVKVFNEDGEEVAEFDFDLDDIAEVYYTD